MADDLARLKAVTAFTRRVADALERRGFPRREVAELRQLLARGDQLCSDPDPDGGAVASVLGRMVWYLDQLADEA